MSDFVRYSGVRPAPRWREMPRGRSFAASVISAFILAAVAAVGAGILQSKDEVIAWLRAHLSAAPVERKISADPLHASFSICSGGHRFDCVVDGDTFWFHGEKIRISDIDAPEISEPHCERELQLGEAAKQRLRELLNAGNFSLAAGERDEDRYRRKLRAVHRDGHSLGEMLVTEGLARRWNEPRRNWCG